MTKHVRLYETRSLQYSCVLSFILTCKNVPQARFISKRYVNKDSEAYAHCCLDVLILY